MSVAIERYLDRIACDGQPTVTAETLHGLHRARMLAVPFENLDIHAGREIALDEARIVSKIVDRRHGGFCSEVDGAHAAFPREMGFPVTSLSTGVRRAAARCEHADIVL